MAMLREESGRGKKSYTVGSPEWIREQKLLADQRNRQKMVKKQKQMAARPTGYLDPEEIPLPSGDTATRNPVDMKPVTYTPDIEDFEKGELRKTKKAAIERKRGQLHAYDPIEPQVQGQTSWDEIQKAENDELHNWKNVAIEQAPKDNAVLSKTPDTESPNLSEYIIQALNNAANYIDDRDQQQAIDRAKNTILKEELIDDPYRDFSQYLKLNRDPNIDSSQYETNTLATVNVSSDGEALLHYDSSIATIFLTACSFLPGPGGVLATIINSAMNADNFQEFAESAGGSLIPGPLGDIYSVYDCAQTLKKNKLNPIVAPGDKMITITLEKDRDVIGYTFLIDKDMNIKIGPETWETNIPHSGWDSYEQSHPKPPMQLNIEGYSIAYDYD